MQRQSRQVWFVLALLVLVGGLTFALALAPPSSADYDSLTYHLAVPAQYLRHGQIVQLEYDHHSYFPFTLEMWFMLALAARGPVLAKLFHWLMLPLGALTIAAIARRSVSPKPALWAALAYVTLPMVMILSSTAYIDLGFTAFALLAVLAFVRAVETAQVSWWCICGAFCGFCMGSKYLGGLIFGFLLIWTLVLLFVGKRSGVKELLGFVVVALVLGGPWYLRNFLWTGNPVYPFAYGIFGGKGWTAAMAAQYELDQARFGFGKSLVDLLLLPVRLGFTPLNLQMPYWPFNDRIMVSGNNNGFFEVMGMVLYIFPGPVWLALGMPALFLKKKPPGLLISLGLASFLWCFWAVTSQQVRYILPGVALYCLAGAWVLGRAEGRYRFTPVLAKLLLVLWTAFSLCFLVRYGGNTWRVVLGEWTPDIYLERTFAGYSAMKWASTATPEAAKFAVYGEPRCFYLKRDYFWADDAHNNLINYSAINGPEKLVAALKAHGTQYVLCNEGTGNGGFGGPPPYWAEVVENGAAVLEYSARGYAVYQLK